MKPEFKTTMGRMIVGQPMPNPKAPEGEGWQLQSTAPGHDADGKPALIWSWFRQVKEEGDEEELLQ